MKSGAKIGSGFRTLFWGLLVLAHLQQAPKTEPFLGPRFGRRSTATTFTLELAFGTVKSGGGSNKRCQMQSLTYMCHPVILVQLQPKRAGWFQLAACTHCFLHLAATVEALCARAHFLRVFSGSLMNPPNRQKMWDDFNRSCILLPRLLPKSCRHNDRFLSALVRLLFQAYLVLYRPKQGGRQGTAWRSSTLQDVRQNPSPALEESPRMGTEFGCKICMLCADCM